MNIEEFEKIMQRDDKEEKEVRKNISGQGLPEELGKQVVCQIVLIKKFRL